MEIDRRISNQSDIPILAKFGHTIILIVTKFVIATIIRGKHFGKTIYRRGGKRFVDVVGAIVLLVGLFPLMAVLAAIVAIDGGSPFYSHKRVGRHGKQFGCLKIRSMSVDAEARLAAILRNDSHAAHMWAQDQKLDEDPRITPVGRLLRKTSLDELPQLVNVLLGDMSLVGPRPVTTEELERYRQLVPVYCSIRPGMTGPWQVKGRNRLGFGERIKLDTDYATKFTFFNDVSILFATIFVVLKADGK